MPEENSEEQSLQITDWRNYWALVKRRRWYLLVPLFATWMVLWSVSWFLPSVYRSSTLILVEQPTVSKIVDPSSGDMSNDLQSRLDSLTEQVLSRTRLVHIIDSLNLYPKLRQRATPDDLVERMRKDIQIDTVRSPGNELSAFTISFLAENPRVAQQVTTELTNMLITGVVENSNTNAKDTTDFLASQLAEKAKDLAAQEEKIREFNDRHLGELPDQLQSNLQILSGLQTQMQAEQDSLGRANQQNAYLDSLINQYKTMGRATRPGDGSSGGGLPAIDQDLQKLRAQLADLESRYTDRYPDVIKVKDEIARTEKLRQQFIAQSKARSAQSDGSSDNSVAYAPDGRELPLAEVQSQLKGNQIEIANRQRAIVDLEKRINDYQSRLNATPVAQQELADLKRDYTQTKTDYDSLLAKKNQAELTQNLFQQQQGEHFRMIDPPSLPTKPDSPNRFRLSLAGLFGGLVLGAVSVAGSEYLDDRIYTEKELKKLLPTQVLVELPPLSTVEEDQAARQQHKLEFAVAGLMMLVILVGVAFSFLRG